MITITHILGYPAYLTTDEAINLYKHLEYASQGILDSEGY